MSDKITISLEPTKECVAVGELSDDLVNAAAVKLMKGRFRDAGVIEIPTDDDDVDYLEGDAFTMDRNAAARFEQKCLPQGFERIIDQDDDVELKIELSPSHYESLAIFHTNSEASNRSRAVIAANVRMNGRMEMDV